MYKDDLRKNYKNKRIELSDLEINQAEKVILEKVKNLNFTGVDYAHIFLPIKKQKEINTKDIIEYLWSINIKTVVSVSNFKDYTLKHYIYDSDTELVIKKFGIPEPINAVEIDVKKLDLIFVPLLISDKRGYRVGYGKGFYDRFLTECKDSIKTIGINYHKSIEIIKDINEYDIPLQKIITGEL